MSKIKGHELELEEIICLATLVANGRPAEVEEMNVHFSRIGQDCSNCEYKEKCLNMEEI